MKTVYWFGRTNNLLWENMFKKCVFFKYISLTEQLYLGILRVEIETHFIGRVELLFPGD